MKKFNILILFSILAISVPNFFSCGNVNKYYLSPDLILKEIELKGAKKVLDDLWSDIEKEKDSKLYFVSQKISTGDSKWLEVAKALRLVSDAGATESLFFSVARALPNAPELVLKMIGNSFPLNELCTLPFIEGELEIEEEYLDRAEKALMSVQEPELQEVCRECLKRIHYLQVLVLRGKQK